MTGEFPGITTMTLPGRVKDTVMLIMVFLALHNLRSSRGDRRNAFRCALVIGGLYALLHALSFLLQNEPWFDGRNTGHVIDHALEVWVVYMAVEPYVRRVWPRMLVGVVRLLSGRLRDPAVGREVLIGVVAGCGLVAMLALAYQVEWRVSVNDAGRLPHWVELISMRSLVDYLAFESHLAAWTAVRCASIAGLLVAIRLLVRHKLAANGVSVLAIGAMSYAWFMNYAGESVAVALLFAAIFGGAIVLLYARAGILAGAAAVFLVVPYHRALAGLDTWAAAHTVTEVAVVLGLATYGLCVSLAGQPIFNDILAEPASKT
jgi:hypothetical protein